MGTDSCSTLARCPSRPEFRFGFPGVGLLVGLVVCSWGCSADRSGAARSRINVMLAERLGAVVAQHVDPGEVVFVHLSSAPGEADQWIKGLHQGLSEAYIVIELGPDQLPAEAKGGMGGNPALQYALQQYPNAKAIVTTRPVGAHERPVFPRNHPPVFALKWSYLPDSAHLFDGGHLVAGIFARPEWDPAVDDDSSLSPEALFDRNYVLATPENLRELVSEY